MKKTSTRKKNPHKPELKWQTGAYSSRAEYSFILPYPFLLLCRLMNTTPEQVLIDFMDNISCGSCKRAGRDKAKKHLLRYFIAHGYGQYYYAPQDIRRMFKELDALGLLFPANGEDKTVDLYTKWRDEYHSYWFEKWKGKATHTPR